MPGITVYPRRSRTVTPLLEATSAPGWTATILPPSITTFWSSTAGLPVPSITRTCASTTRGEFTRMYFCVSGESVTGGCAFSATADKTSGTNNISERQRFMASPDVHDIVLVWPLSPATHLSLQFKLCNQRLNGGSEPCAGTPLHANEPKPMQVTLEQSHETPAE